MFCISTLQHQQSETAVERKSLIFQQLRRLFDCQATCGAIRHIRLNRLLIPATFFFFLENHKTAILLAADINAVIDSESHFVPSLPNHAPVLLAAFPSF
jgi:hypothetical protein